VAGNEGCHTRCHHCGKLLLERKGYTLGPMGIEQGKCKFCNTSIPGRWEG